ncbi:MAG: hypothetical protein R6U96_07030 [Promethearchaeia archaeon]
MIKNIFIMKADTGELIFYKAFQDIFNIKLTSGFLSAIYSFVKQTLKTHKLNEIEVGPFRFIFEIEKIDDTELLFALFSDRTDNLVELRKQLIEIKNEFLEKYDISYVNRNYGGEISQFSEFEQNINEILDNSKDMISEEIRNDILKVFNELHTFSSFVISSALLTQTGRVIVSNLDEKVLSEIIRLLEGRFLIGNNTINELVTLEKFGILSLAGIEENYISVIQFKKSCPFETGLIIAKKFKSRIKKLIY